MCLLTPKGSRKIAEDDIHVYKIIKPAEEENHWSGPFHQTNMPFDEICETVPPEEDSIEQRTILGKDVLMCGPGFLHSYLFENKAIVKYLILTWPISTVPIEQREHYVIANATIPKGSVYYEQVSYRGETPVEIASNKLIVHRLK